MVPQPNQLPHAQPESPYNQLGPENSGAPSFSWKLFTFSLIILITVVALFFGLQLGYGPFLRSSIDSLDEQLNEIGRQIPEEDQARFITFYSQLLNMQSLLSKHVNIAPFFESLETNTHRSVFFSSMNFDVSGQKITLEGRAPNYTVLGQQLERIEEVEAFERYLLSESQADEGGGVNFRIIIFLDQSLLTQVVDSAPAQEVASTSPSTQEESQVEAENLEEEIIE